MTPDQAFVFGTLILALILFVWGPWRYDLVALLALLALTIAGIVPWNQAFAGFGHPAVVTVAAVLIISRSLLKSGVVDVVYRWLSRENSSPLCDVASLTGLVALLSAFMNNVGALALLMPMGIRMARRGGTPPSVLLMPMAFGSLLGGLVTLIGTPPNIIISAFRAETIGEPFDMFDFTPVGAGVLLVGFLFISLIGWRLTPIRKAPLSKDEIFKVENYLTEVRVPKGSSMVGKSLSNLMAADESNVQILGLIRGQLSLPNPTGEEILQPDDILIVKANVLITSGLW